MNSPQSIFWFRNDLRINDNPGLFEACKSGAVLAIYILDDESPNDWKIGGASRVWLHHSLNALKHSLNGNLYVLKGSPVNILNTLCAERDIKRVYWNRCYEPWAIARDTEIKSTLKAGGIEIHSFNASLLWEPWTVTKADGTPYKIFTPFYRRGCLNKSHPRDPIGVIDITSICSSSDLTNNIDEIELLEGMPWETTTAQPWEIGEQGAKRALGYFLNNHLQGYKEDRNLPAIQGVSRLSPHLHFGEISPHTVWYFAAQTASMSDIETDLDCFLSEIAWREFSYYLLYHFPKLPHKQLQPRFDPFPWRRDSKDHLTAWQKGLTGYPIVDAGMRELWQTGYMHNRVRMIVGSFLVKNLLIDWRLGEAWFWDCLFDADLASNSASWQWIAGCGADAAPYFRIFNPTTQGEKFDSEGDYIRQFIPELCKLPNKYIHSPWTLPAAEAQTINFKLGIDYPEPIVDLKASRQAALDAFASLKTAATE